MCAKEGNENINKLSDDYRHREYGLCLACVQFVRGSAWTNTTASTYFMYSTCKKEKPKPEMQPVFIVYMFINFFWFIKYFLSDGRSGLLLCGFA